VPPLGRENFSASVRVRVEKISRSPRAGIAARGCAQVTADENRKARRTNKSTLFAGAERSGAQFGGHRRWPAAGQAPTHRRNGPGVRTSHSVRWRGDCAGATEAGHVWCRGSSALAVSSLKRNGLFKLARILRGDIF